ncbi:mucin-2-like [Ylistrum balloti]|uniref:mucin-2-like n=1 Tax=Ylistrum balloti TaxID=509963 RepID=UPI002905F225|nr:mucin-2-like [Ylistrum balloti]
MVMNQLNQATSQKKPTSLSPAVPPNTQQAIFPQYHPTTNKRLSRGTALLPTSGYPAVPPNKKQVILSRYRPTPSKPFSRGIALLPTSDSPAVPTNKQQAILPRYCPTTNKRFSRGTDQQPTSDSPAVPTNNQQAILPRYRPTTNKRFSRAQQTSHCPTTRLPNNKRFSQKEILPVPTNNQQAIPPTINKRFSCGTAQQPTSDSPSIPPNNQQQGQQIFKRNKVESSDHNKSDTSKTEGTCNQDKEIVMDIAPPPASPTPRSHTRALLWTLLGPRRPPDPSPGLTHFCLASYAPEQAILPRFCPTTNKPFSCGTAQHPICDSPALPSNNQQAILPRYRTAGQAINTMSPL